MVSVAVDLLDLMVRLVRPCDVNDLLRSSPSGLRLGGDQHPAEQAAGPEHVARGRGCDPSLLDWVEVITIPSHPTSPIVHVHLRSVAKPSASASARPPIPTTPAPRSAPSFDITGEESLLQDMDIVYEVGVWTVRAPRLRGQELIAVHPIIQLAITTMLLHKECKRAASVINAAVTKVLAKRK
ncbi:hypothetical protein H4582DRAFT_235472 [Lactarius indigo]|nr:hypothetical protein H4582DRAFT_235472 [Lactarius indigo]